MGARLTSGERKVAMFDSTSGIAFGPVFDDPDEAEAFLGWLPLDPRTYTASDLADLYTNFTTMWAATTA